jgi:hypothetical protein
MCTFPAVAVAVACTLLILPNEALLLGEESRTLSHRLSNFVDFAATDLEFVLEDDRQSGGPHDHECPVPFVHVLTNRHCKSW